MKEEGGGREGGRYGRRERATEGRKEEVDGGSGRGAGGREEGRCYLKTQFYNSDSPCNSVEQLELRF